MIRNMARNRGFVWEDNELRTEIGALDGKMRAAVTALVDYHGTRGEAQMKTEAPWTDRTSAARNGLFTTTIAEQRQWRLVFAHAVNYGIWLEVANQGRYQIIMPTLLEIGADLMRNLDALMRKI